MGKIFYLLGKSATGKDTIFDILKRDEELKLRTILLYTTRPMREGEVDGVTYHFVTQEELNTFRREGRLIECRTYQTVHGPWSYATVEGSDWDLSRQNFLTVGTLESYRRMKAHFPENSLVPLYIEVEDGERLRRAWEREHRQPRPGYEEMCRRFLADQADFAPDRLAEAGVDETCTYSNQDLGACVARIRQTIRENM